MLNNREPVRRQLKYRRETWCSCVARKPDAGMLRGGVEAEIATIWREKRVCFGTSSLGRHVAALAALAREAEIPLVQLAFKPHPKSVALQ